jgi:hypothetical protein
MWLGRHAQNLRTLPIAVIILPTPDGLLPSFRQLVPKLLTALATLIPQSLVELQL